MIIKLEIFTNLNSHASRALIDDTVAGCSKRTQDLNITFEVISKSKISPRTDISFGNLLEIANSKGRLWTDPVSLFLISQPYPHIAKGRKSSKSEDAYIAFYEQCCIAAYDVLESAARTDKGKHPLLQTAILHEIGHFFNLSHTTCGTMMDEVATNSKGVWSKKEKSKIKSYVEEISTRTRRPRDAATGP